ncbi:MAG TPA: YihY/virulence factor BrkB family protein [Acidimicrobiales bacterium]|nr:YihY/virulence factor BrkB family protein [Acidimicrobiales bacterium]
MTDDVTDDVTALVDREAPVLRSTLTHMKMNRVNIAAGAFAYRWFLAIFPIIIGLLGIATLVTVSRTVVLNLLHGVTKSLPSGAAQVFTGAISHATQRSGADLLTTIVACVVALWSATSGMVIVEEALDMAYDVPQDRSFLAKRLVALPLLLGATVLGSAASALIIFGPQLGTLIRHSAPIGGAAFSTVWTIVRFLIALGLMNFLMAFLYYVAPNRPRARWRWFSPGAFVATILWALVSWGFSIYTSHFGSYGNTYGAFAGVAILIFWLYLTGLAILSGGELNAAIERRDFQAQRTTAAPEEAPPSS